MSNNLQKIIEYGKDPSCVACITPMFGGAWHSSIRTGEGPQPVLPPVAGDSIAQRLGLLTKYNCDTSNLDFRLASTAENNWYVKTGLSFAGWSKALTIIGRMYVAPDNGGTGSTSYDTNGHHPLIAQGYSPSNNTGKIIMTFGYVNQAGINRYQAQLSLSSGTLVTLVATPITDPRGKWVVPALTIDSATGAWAIYEDGVQLATGINSSLIGFALSSNVSDVDNDAVAHLHARRADYVNRLDMIAWCKVDDAVANPSEIKYLSYDRDNWIDLSLPVESGTINITTDSIPELEWTLPDGTKSTASTLNQTVEAGTLRMKCYKYGKTFRISVSTALQNSTIKVKDLPRVTYFLQLISLSGLTGNVSDLPRVTNALQLNTIPRLTGSTADLPRVTSTLQLNTIPGLTGSTAGLPRVTNTLYLNTIPGLTGSTADLPLNTGATRQIFNMSGIAGALSVVSTNTNVYYYGNAQVTPAEYDQTIQNIVDAGGMNGTLRISNTRTSASDANIATLQSRGWTVTEH